MSVTIPEFAQNDDQVVITFPAKAISAQHGLVQAHLRLDRTTTPSPMWRFVRVTCNFPVEYWPQVAQREFCYRVSNYCYVVLVRNGITMTWPYIDGSAFGALVGTGRTTTTEGNLPGKQWIPVEQLVP